MRSKSWQFALAVAVAVGFLVLLYVVAEFGRMRLRSAEEDVRRAHIQLTRVVDLYQLLMNAESGHRGYLLTGDLAYLEPLHRAEGRIGELTSQLARTYRGADERVGAAIHQLGGVAGARMAQMEESIAVYGEQGPAAALKLANSPSRHETMAAFRELAGTTREYEQALLEGSLVKWERELTIVGRLNLATLLVGLVLAALAVTATVRNMRQRAEAAAELERQHHELKAQFDAQAGELAGLAQHLQHVQEEERARLSRELHDELGGVLMAARMDATWMQKHAPGNDPNVKQRLERLRQVLDQGIELKRRVVEELRPSLLDTMGLLAALRWQVEETCQRARLRCSIHFPDDEPKLNRDGAIALFRVVQESLANVAKHAQASKVEITWEVKGDELIVTVRDDGIGALPEDLTRPRSHGIAGMRHRVHVLGGRLEISSVPNGGTTLQARLPLASVAEVAGSDDNNGVTAASRSPQVGDLREDPGQPIAVA
jgi:signal transduction histidine kinase